MTYTYDYQIIVYKQDSINGAVKIKMTQCGVGKM